jgi:predicted ATPase
VRVLLVLTFRSDEIHRSHPLRPLIAAWERVRSVRRLELPRFTREEATRQLEAILGSPPPRPMLEPLYERSEGNAFLIEEILAAMQAGAGPEELPVTLRDVLLARAERLSEPALRLLRVAATAGTSVSDRLFAAVAGLDEASLDAALAEVIEHQLLAADDTDHGYRFRHAPHCCWPGRRSPSRISDGRTTSARRSSMRLCSCRRTVRASPARWCRWSSRVFRCGRWTRSRPSGTRQPWKR